MARRSVLVVAAGAAWEPAVLALIEREPALVLLKRCVDVDDLLASVAAGQAEIVVVGIDAPGLDADAVTRLRDAGVQVAAVLPEGSEAAAARAARIGLRLAVGDGDVQELAQLLATGRVQDGSAAVEEVDSEAGRGAAGGRIVVVWGPAGAPGRTTLAVAVATLLAQRGQTVTLIDADPAGGTIAQHLGVLDEVSGLLAAGRLSTAGRLEEHWAGVARALTERLLVVTGLPRADRWREVPTGALAELSGSAAREGWVVIDTGAGLDPDRDRLTLEAIGVAEELLVVGTAEPVGLARLARGLGDLVELATAPPRVVVNRHRRSLGASDDEVAALVRRVCRPVAVHLLPEDRAAVDRALVTQRALPEAASESALGRALSRLVGSLSPDLPAARTRTEGRAHRR